MFGLDKLLSKKDQKITLNSPVKGQLIDKAAIPDPTFADGILGATAGFLSSDGVIYAPCDGQITQIFRTGHALTITSVNGVEILIHVGINTVDLKGRGFKALVEQDQKVKCGDELIKFEIETIKEAGFSLEIPMVICNGDDFAKVEFIAPCEVTPASAVCTIEKK
ncbi:MAG: PTS glucose transporter subunit IIA [Proteobacteria bacterium]|uniref:PTS system glucose-specific EIIA component n=1 Tax=Candidatus Avisuccinivibrio stercorigallinarum TaxID=2840704 RepID=A0A9D9DBQ7_9GAMM|nr:PTS glucose transporter subunit IIA [Candidatus Avisuccinivibrio stercorigallinarum]